jgi:hypothetical protein
MPQRTCPECGIIISARARKCRRCANKRAYNDAAGHEWREAVLERDNLTCRKAGCGRHDHLQGHHVLNWRREVHLRLDVENGVTLCAKHHNEFHRRFGKFDNSWFQMKHFLKEAKDDSQAVL